jgi:hypothetical protein
MRTNLHHVDSLCTSCNSQMIENPIQGVSELSQECEFIMKNQIGVHSIPIKTSLNGSLVNAVELGDSISMIVKILQLYNYSKLVYHPIVETFQVVKLMNSIASVKKEQENLFDTFRLQNAHSFKVSATLVSLLGGKVCFFQNGLIKYSWYMPS